MNYNGETPLISGYPFNSKSVMIISGAVSGAVKNEYLDVDTEIEYTNAEGIKNNGIVKSYKSMLTVAGLILEIPLGSSVKNLETNFQGLTIETETSSGNNINILYDAQDVQNHSSLTNKDGFNSTTSTDIVVQGQSTIILTTQSGVIDGLSFNINNNVEIPIKAGDSLPRIDLVVLKKNQLLSTIEIELKQGVPSSNPLVPSITQVNLGLYELPVFRVYVNVAQTTLSRNNITDLRNPTSKHNAIGYSDMAGIIEAFAGQASALPPSTLYCDGREVSRITYARLFQRIGVAWGAGNGTSTFNLPDGRGGVLKGAGQSSKYGTYTQADGTVASLEENRGAVGTYQSTAIRNIEGQMNRISTYYFSTSPYASKACSATILEYAGGRATGASSKYLEISFNTSRVVPTGETNRDNNLAVHFIIFY